MIKKNVLFLIIFIGVLGAIIFLFGIYADSHKVRMLSKPIPVIACLAILFINNDNAYSRLIRWGLIFGLVGDIFLEHSPTTFIPGLIAFLIGHLFYIFAFYKRKKDFSPVIFIAVFLILLIIFLRLRPDLKEMTIPVACYIIVIGTMIWRAFALIEKKKLQLYQLSAAGGALFFGISDTVLAFNRFHSRISGADYLIILLYWAAQVAITVSAILIKVTSQSDATSG